MEDPKWLRLITIGLILAALAIGYFLLTGGLVKKSSKPQTQTAVSTPSPAIRGDSIIVPEATATPSAYTRIVDRAQGGVRTLPATGVPVGLMLLFASSAMVVGFSLRKYPH